MICDGFNNNTDYSMETVKEEANKLILILEDMIEIILSSDDIGTISIKLLKERTIDAKNYIFSLKDRLVKSKDLISDENYNICKRELDVYDNEFMNDVVTMWILNGSKEEVVDKLYSACYRVRELIRRVNQ